MLKAEAEKQAQELTDKGLAVFCPMAKTACRNDCICFVKAELRNYEDEFEQNKYSNTWLVNAPYCDNQSLHGT